VELSVHCLSPPNTYSYVQEENLGSTSKFIENYSLFMCITNQILALHLRSIDGLEELSKTVEKVPPAHVQWVYEDGRKLPPPVSQQNLSIVLEEFAFHTRPYSNASVGRATG
jgi:hypothetical protein